MFQTDTGSTLYSYSNRTPVTVDISLVIVIVLFGTVFTAFLLIFPGIRKERWTTFFTVSLIVFVGVTIGVALLGSSWHKSTAVIFGTYSVFSKHKITAEIGGYVGLTHINITYEVIPHYADVRDIQYNERFYWRQPQEMMVCFKDALRRGIPFPIISLAEYFTLNQDGFSWGGKYREAGYYTSVMLWTSLAFWLMTNLMLFMVPRYSAYCMIITGLSMLFANFTYFLLLPSDPLIAHINGSVLNFTFGWCFWMVLLAGMSCFLAGVIITAIDMIFPHSFSTILEVDYDTPYDRHVIIEESFDMQKNDVGKRVSHSKNSSNNQLIREVSSKLLNKSKNSNQEVLNLGYIDDPSDVIEEPSKQFDQSYNNSRNKNYLS